jgi:hypothetical protein
VIRYPNEKKVNTDNVATWKTIPLPLHVNGRSNLTLQFDARPPLAIRLLGRRRLRRMLAEAHPPGHLALRHVVEQFAAEYGYLVIEFDATPTDDDPIRVARSDVIAHLGRVNDEAL